ncbi:hypothetical protein [Blautia sp. Marseille-P3201T]|uniref:hypothetical protein n=1 Tax=Blautia sp. Marseille-P3201T TaxID=1907659 RepID=UPI000AACE8DE|nr:hypothetical protein [Blautia sp. Marseille-P3201T]
MTGYCRFIAYVYEYTYGKKGNGKGFIRVEAKDGICRMDYKLTGICSQESAPARIYGYVREKEECTAILLGECDLAGSNVQFTLEIPQINIGDSSYGFGDIKGLVILGQSGETYGSGWDDQPIQLDAIHFPEETDVPIEEKQEEEAVEPPIIMEKSLEVKTEPVPPVPEAEITETEEFMPFPDGSVLECKRITPMDDQLLASQDRGLLNNQFLRHGFSQYGHLLLGIRQEDNKHILGVPGVYERQEALMAGMLGFPYFKETGERQPDGKLQGYWYRVVNTK